MSKILFLLLLISHLYWSVLADADVDWSRTNDVHHLQEKWLQLEFELKCAFPVDTRDKNTQWKQSTKMDKAAAVWHELSENLKMWSNMI